jgi:hypothetical protein
MLPPSLSRLSRQSHNPISLQGLLRGSLFFFFFFYFLRLLVSQNLCFSQPWILSLDRSEKRTELSSFSLRGSCASHQCFLTFIIQSIHKRMVRFQKLIKMYFTPYTSAAYTISSEICPCFSCATSSSLHAYCEAAGQVSKMASHQEEAFCVLRFEVSKSVITVQHEFRARSDGVADWLSVVI